MQSRGQFRLLTSQLRGGCETLCRRVSYSCKDFHSVGATIFFFYSAISGTSDSFVGKLSSLGGDGLRVSKSCTCLTVEDKHFDGSRVLPEGESLSKGYFPRHWTVGEAEGQCVACPVHCLFCCFSRSLRCCGRIADLYFLDVSLEWKPRGKLLVLWTYFRGEIKAGLVLPEVQSVCALISLDLHCFPFRGS